MLGFALFPFQAIKQGSEIFEFAVESEDAHFFFPQRPLQVFQLAHDLTQFALHRKRAFGPLFAACDGHVVEAFSGLRQEERVGILNASPRATSEPGRYSHPQLGRITSTLAEAISTRMVF
jgi:hypothetical protein